MRQGKGKNATIFSDEGMKLRCQERMLLNGNPNVKPNIAAAEFKSYANEKIAPDLQKTSGGAKLLREA